MEEPIIISIIIPIYNVEELLPRCIESLLHQTYSDIELICIDDGSKDKSGEILDDYAKENKQIRVYHTENKGVSAARNLGLSKVKGNYIAFVDADDFCDLTMYDKLYKKALETDAELVMCDVINYWDDNHQEKLHITETNGIIPVNEYKQKVFSALYPSYSVNKLYKKELWKDVLFPVNCIMQEDTIALLTITHRVKKVAIIKDALYYYQQARVNSAMGMQTEKHLLDAYYACRETLKFVQKEYPQWQLGPTVNVLLAAKRLLDRYACKNIEKYSIFFNEMHQLLQSTYAQKSQSWQEFGFSDNYRNRMLFYLTIAVKNPKLYPYIKPLLDGLNEFRLKIKKLLRS